MSDGGCVCIRRYCTVNTHGNQCGFTLLEMVLSIVIVVLKVNVIVVLVRVVVLLMVILVIMIVVVILEQATAFVTLLLLVEYM